MTRWAGGHTGPDNKELQAKARDAPNKPAATSRAAAPPLATRYGLLIHPVALLDAVAVPGAPLCFYLMAALGASAAMALLLEKMAAAGYGVRIVDL